MQRITNPDDQVIAMVNAATENRRRVAEQREVLRRMDREQRERMEEACRRDFRRILMEAGSCGGLGCLVLVAMAKDMISAGFAMPLAVACFVWAAIRADRYFRGKRK